MANINRVKMIDASGCADGGWAGIDVEKLPSARKAIKRQNGSNTP